VCTYIVFLEFFLCLKLRQHDAQEAFLQVLLWLKEESCYLLSEFKSTLSKEELQEFAENDVVATSSLSLSTRFNADCTNYLRCEDKRRDGCGGLTEQIGDNNVYGTLQLIVIPPLEKSGSSGIQEMLAEYCSSQFIEDRRCPDCGRTGFTEKYCVVSTVPSVLIVQIKRNIYDLHTQKVFKEKTRVSFPAILTFSDNTRSFPQMFFTQQENYVCKVYPKCSDLFEAPPSSNIFNCVEECKSVSKSNLQYALSSVIRHHGEQMNTGHYTIDVCDEGVNNVKRWIRYDDNIACELTEVYY